MIGRLLDGGRPVAVMDDDGDWRPADPGDPRQSLLAELLNGAHHPLTDRQTGDHHQPYGVLALDRAAAALNLTAELARPVEDLPDGAIS